MAVDKFLKDLSEEVGFKFGSPWRYSDKSLGVIVPILRLDAYSAEQREYLTLEEAKDKGVTFKDTGHIDRVIVESSLGVPIFIRSGTALKSAGTQPRVVETSTMIVPEGPKKEEIPPIPIITKQEILVRCIYASKPIQKESRFTHAGDVPLEVRSELLSKSDQARTWSAVSHATNRFMGSHVLGSGRSGRGSARMMNASSDDLVGAMEEVDKFTPNLDEILKKVPLFEDQVGAVFLDMKDVVGMELFDHPRSWEAIHKEVEKRLGESVAKEEDQSFFKPDYDKVKPLTLTFLKKLIESKKTEISHGITSTVSLKGDGVIGEATTINGKVIHLVGIKTGNIPKKLSEISRTVAADDAIRHAITSNFHAPRNR